MTQKMITGCFGLATDGKGKFLLTLRNDPHDLDAHHLWQIPGGEMEFGEDPIETVVRELQEEINCTPTILDPRPTVCTSVWPAKPGKDTDYHITLITYLVSIGDQIPQQTEESLDCKWFTLEEIMQLETLPNVQENCQALAQVADFY